MHSPSRCWVPLVFTNINRISRNLVLSCNMQDQGPTSGTDVPSQLHVVSTAPDTKNIPGQKKKEKISEQPKVCLSFSPCKLQPHFDYVFWSLLPFFSPFAWWHSLSAAIGNIIHSVSIHGTSFSHKYEAKKVCKNTITICRGGKLIFGSQEGERTECFQSAGPTGSERRGPLRNSILSHIFSRQLIFQELKK